MKTIIASILVLILIGCANLGAGDRQLVLKYSDFGTFSLCEELIGQDWWQWQGHGDSTPRDYDIKVVVFRNIDISKVKKIYPVIPEKKQDYRYVSYERALEFLEKTINELNALEEPLFIQMADGLKKTREKIMLHFN